MSVSMSSPDKVSSAHDLELTLNAEGPRFSLSWGSGSRRKVLDTDSPELAAALLRLDQDVDSAGLTEQLARELSIGAEDVQPIVSYLSDYGFFGDSAGDSFYEEWVKLGWADALALHTATANSKWVHDYRGAPKVMVRDFDNRPVLPQEARPKPFRPSQERQIKLPEPAALDLSYSDFLSRRKTHRYFPGTSVSMTDIATIAKWTLTKDHHPDQKFVSPTYIDDGPFVGYFLFDRLQHEQAPTERFSAYAYNPDSHALGLVNASDALDGWSSLLWTQVFGNGAPVAFVLAVDWPQYMWKYRMSRSYRWVFSEIGSFMHTAVAVANSLGLKAFQTPAVDDRKICEFLRVDPNVLYPVYWANFGRITTPAR